MGYGTYETQYLTIAVYIFGGLTFVDLAFSSDRIQSRAACLLGNGFSLAAICLRQFVILGKLLYLYQVLQQEEGAN